MTHVDMHVVPSSRNMRVTTRLPLRQLEMSAVVRPVLVTALTALNRESTNCFDRKREKERDEGGGDGDAIVDMLLDSNGNNKRSNSCGVFR